MKKIFKEYENEIKIKPIDETLNDVEFVKKIKCPNDKKYTLKSLRTKKIIKWSTIIALPSVVIGTLSIFVFFDITDRDSVYKKHFSLSEVHNINKNTFKSLNEINYPKDLSKKSNELDKEFVEAFNKFSYRIFEEGKTKDNFGYSPISLYHHLDVLSGLANNDLNSSFDSLLGINSEIRDKEVKKNFLNNFYQDKDNGMSLYNGFFIDNKYKLKKEKIDFLTKKYVEAFELDINKDYDVELMLKWINDKVNITLDKENLMIQKDTIFYLFSTMSYVNSWNTLFLKENTSAGEFYDTNGNKKDVKYMSHSYIGTVTEYDEYLSFYDYYRNGYKIQYIFTKNKNDRLEDVLKNTNYLIDDETMTQEAYIKLKVPKFTFNDKIEFNDILGQSEIGEIYDKNANSFNEMLKNDDIDYSYLMVTEQRNYIEFNEDGTKIKTLTSTMAGAATNPGAGEGYQITLDHEFYYIIKDQYNIPIFMGKYNS